MLAGFLGMAAAHSEPRIQAALILLMFANALFLWK
jgi:hypothetical protein